MCEDSSDDADAEEAAMLGKKGEKSASIVETLDGLLEMRDRGRRVAALERLGAAGESPLGFFFSRLRRGALELGHKAARIRGYFGQPCAPWGQTLE